LEQVFDPTGAGDTFAGGFMGFISSDQTIGKKISISEQDFRKAVVYGSVLASFTVEDFSVGRLSNLKKEEIDTRLHAFMKLSNMD
ncbi:MAG: PfkB family carbohydrate kinase, partial [Thermodesulfobacteriota bacterium]